MSAGTVCQVPVHREQWVVLQRNARCSAFDGYRQMWSPYSEILYQPYEQGKFPLRPSARPDAQVSR